MSTRLRSQMGVRQNMTSSTSSWCQLIYPLLCKNTYVIRTHEQARLSIRWPPFLSFLASKMNRLRLDAVLMSNNNKKKRKIPLIRRHSTKHSVEFKGNDNRDENNTYCISGVFVVGWSTGRSLCMRYAVSRSRCYHHPSRNFSCCSCHCTAAHLYHHLLYRDTRSS